MIEHFLPLPSFYLVTREEKRINSNALCSNSDIASNIILEYEFSLTLIFLYKGGIKDSVKILQKIWIAPEIMKDILEVDERFFKFITWHFSKKAQFPLCLIWRLLCKMWYISHLFLGFLLMTWRKLMLVR